MSSTRDARTSRRSGPRVSEFGGQRTFSRKRLLMTSTLVTFPAPTRPDESLTDAVKVSRLPSTFSRTTSAETVAPIPTGARWSNCTRTATDVEPCSRWPSSALQVASSHRAMRRGVARTGTSPDLSASAVSFLETVNVTLLFNPGRSVTVDTIGMERLHWPDYFSSGSIYCFFGTECCRKVSACERLAMIHR